MRQPRPVGSRETSESGGTMELIGRQGDRRLPVHPIPLELGEAVEALADVTKPAVDAGPLQEWTGGSPRFEVGQPITWHYLRTTVTAIVIHDSADELAVWIPSGAMRLAWIPADGRAIRELPLAERFGQKWRMVERAWSGQGIVRIVRPGQPWSVWHFWEAGGTYGGAYLNLEAPHRRPAQVGLRSDSTGDQPHAVPLELARTHSFDQILDLWVEPSEHGAQLWLKDADELEAAVEQGWFTEHQADAIRSIGEHAARQLFDADPEALWRDWEPWRAPAEWDRPLQLPETDYIRRLKEATG